MNLQDNDKTIILKKLKNINKVKVQTDIPLKRYTSFQVGGPAELLVVPENIKTLKKIITTLKNTKLPLLILGKGTNIIVSDKGFRGIVIYTGKLNKVKVKNNMIKAQAGTTLSRAAKTALNNNLTGMEFAAGIPGSLGGALYMNAGAYGSEIKDIITKAVLYNYAGKKITLSKEELNLSYRHSILKEKSLIAAVIYLKLKTGSKTKIKKTMKELHQKRKAKQPLSRPSAGSIFKRPPDNYAGALIEKAGLKGTQIGGAAVSTKHAGFIINKGSASAADIKNLITYIQGQVQQKFGVKLEPEPIFIGEF